jgi:L-fuconolactonase
MLALRMPLYRPAEREQWQAGRYDPLLAAAQCHGVPVCTYPPGLLRELVPTIEAYPDLQFVLDHLGLPQPTPHGTRDREPFARLPDLLNLAQFPNVAVKISAAPVLSLEPFPFRDLWPPLHQVISSFGLERVMWGSDWTRVTQSHTYAEGLAYLAETDELSQSDKEQLLGKTLMTVLRWRRAERNAGSTNPE